MAVQDIPKIVLTGAPSSGKSSVMKELSQIYGNQVLLFPESAVVLLSGGYPAPDHNDLEQIRYFQKSILQVQAGLEFSLPRTNPSAKFWVFDRANLDGGGFWPPGPEDFYTRFQVNPQQEYDKFTHILFLELPRPEMFGGVGQLRFHNFEQSLESEKRLESVWKNHPQFCKIGATSTCEEKVQAVVTKIKQILQAKG